MATTRRRKKAKKIAQEYGYRKYMIERYLKLWGEEETLKFIKACEEEIRTAIRANELKAPIGELLRRLEDKEVELESIEWLEEGFYADFHGFSPGAMFEHLIGLYYVQGVPSMTVTRILDPQPGEIVFDLAAAPGGKTTHVAQLMRNEGQVVAIEKDKLRIVGLKSNLMRCGVKNTIVLRGDATKISEIPLTPDRILLDAPCSGEGLIPIDSTRKTSKTMADIRYCATNQGRMLDAAVDSLGKEGIIVYSTCSIAPEENEFVIDDLLKRREDIEIVPIDVDFGLPGYTNPYNIQMNDNLCKARRLLPHKHQTEGFFMCKLRKVK
ncbi:MAG: RsmB/NOP family class I SAM-dependent RNA methyltransferase [Promethearchaeati archaeon]